MKRVLTDGELNTYARERATQVVVGHLHVFRRDIDGVGVQFRQNLWHRLLYEVVDVDSIHIFVFHDVQQVVELVAARIDDAQPVAREVVGIECSDEDSYHYADSHDDRHESVFIVCHFYFVIPLFRYSVVP